MSCVPVSDFSLTFTHNQFGIIYSPARSIMCRDSLISVVDFNWDYKKAWCKRDTPSCNHVHTLSQQWCMLQTETFVLSWTSTCPNIRTVAHTRSHSNYIHKQCKSHSTSNAIGISFKLDLLLLFLFYFLSSPLFYSTIS